MSLRWVFLPCESNFWSKCWRLHWWPWQMPTTDRQLERSHHCNLKIWDKVTFSNGGEGGELLCECWTLLVQTKGRERKPKERAKQILWLLKRWRDFSGCCRIPAKYDEGSRIFSSEAWLMVYANSRWDSKGGAGLAHFSCVVIFFNWRVGGYWSTCNLNTGSCLYT